MEDEITPIIVGGTGLALAGILVLLTKAYGG